MVRKAREEGCSFLIFGGTRRTEFQKNYDLILINPGSVTLPAKGLCSSKAWLTLDRGSYNLDFVVWDNGG